MLNAVSLPNIKLETIVSVISQWPDIGVLYSLFFNSVRFLNEEDHLMKVISSFFLRNDTFTLKIVKFELLY